MEEEIDDLKLIQDINCIELIPLLEGNKSSRLSSESVESRESATDQCDALVPHVRLVLSDCIKSIVLLAIIVHLVYIKTIIFEYYRSFNLSAWNKSLKFGRNGGCYSLHAYLKPLPLFWAECFCREAKVAKTAILTAPGTTYSHLWHFSHHLIVPDYSNYAIFKISISKGVFITHWNTLWCWNSEKSGGQEQGDILPAFWSTRVKTAYA